MSSIKNNWGVNKLKKKKRKKRKKKNNGGTYPRCQHCWCFRTVLGHLSVQVESDWIGGGGGVRTLVATSSIGNELPPTEDGISQYILLILLSFINLVDLDLQDPSPRRIPLACQHVHLLLYPWIIPTLWVVTPMLQLCKSLTLIW